MKAKDAQDLTKRAEKSHLDAIAAQRRAEANKRKKADALYMQNEYAGFESDVYKQIKQAAKNREKHIYVKDPRPIAWNKLETKLKDDGYNIQADWVTGYYTEYGDSAAPCNVWTEPHWNYKISW